MWYRRNCHSNSNGLDFHLWTRDGIPYIQLTESMWDTTQGIQTDIGKVTGANVLNKTPKKIFNYYILLYYLKRLPLGLQTGRFRIRTIVNLD